MKNPEHFSHPSERHPAMVVTLGVLLVMSIGAVDYMTGPDLSFSIFYLIPVSYVVWHSERRLGILMSFIAALAWLAVDLSSGQVYSHFLFAYWNALVRLGFFLAVTYLLSALKGAQQREKLAVAQEQRHMLLFLMEKIYDPLTGILGNVTMLSGENLPTASKLCLNEIRTCAQEIESVLLELKKFRVANVSALTN